MEAFEQLDNFFMKDNPRTVRSSSAFAGIRHAQNKVNADWKGDRGPTGAAPPWGQGPYANGTGTNPATIEREAARETRELLPIGDIIFGAGGENYEVPGVHSIMSEVLKRYRQGASIDSLAEYASRRLASGENKKDEKMVKDMELTKIDSSLARLMAAAAGWAMSDDVVRSGGGSPRGEATADNQREFERAIARQQREDERRRQQDDERRTAAERRRHERSMRRAMRTRKSLDDYPQFNRMTKFFSEGSDEYHRRTPIMLKKSEEEVLIKEHMPAPPRQGLVWDPVKHRWVRPENSGKTVSEVQGRKRFRGHGVGAHEKRVGGHGKGPQRMQAAGRRFRGATDVAQKRIQRHPSMKGFEPPKLPRYARGNR